MKKLHFETMINAPKATVWDIMLQDATYRDWTSVFNPGGSYYKGGWNEGSKILFIGPDPKTGEIGGMVSRIKTNRLHEYISIEHQGIIKDGKEDTTSETARKWVPAYENYTFKDTNGATKLLIDVDMNEEYVNMFEDMWPKALKRLKELAEKE